MGRQISVLLTAPDLADIEAALLASGEVEFLSDSHASDTSPVVALKTLVIEPQFYGKVPLDCLLIPKPRIGDIVVERHSSVKHRVNITKSYVMEFGRPYYDGKIIRFGRFYYEEEYYEHGEIIAKSDEFRRWSRRMFSRIRRHLRRSPEFRAYIGVDAAARLAAGALVLASN